MASRKSRTLLAILATAFISSCSDGYAAEYGFNYDLGLTDIMAGIRIKEGTQSLGNDYIETELSFGHPRNQNTPTGRVDSTPGPVCIYLNNHYDEDNQEEDKSDYRTMNAEWDYISEIPSSEFWTDAYAFDNDSSKGKTFEHTESFPIKSSYFITEFDENMHTRDITIIVAMVWQDNDDKTWAHSSFGFIDMGYKVKDSEVIFI